MRMRGNRFRVWLSDKEYAHLESQAKKVGLKRGQLLRKLIMGCKVRSKPPDEYLKLIREINAIGNNINQIAHIANAEQTISSDKIDSVVKYLDEIMEKVRDIE